MFVTNLFRGSLMRLTSLAVCLGAVLTPSVVFGQKARLATLDAGTVIPVKLQKELSSKKNEEGDKFSAVVKADSNGYSGLPEGTVVEGVIRAAKQKEGKEAGYLDLAFRRIILPGGRAYDIDGAVIGLDNKSVDKKSDGRLVAKSGRKNNRLVYAGYGAGAGALVGLLGGGKLKLNNILIGGALGYLAGTLDKGKQEPRDVVLKQGTEMGVRLDRFVSVSASTTAYRPRDDEQPRPRDTDRTHDRDSGSGRLDTRRNGARDVDDARDTDTTRDSNADATASPIGVLIDEEEVKFASNAAPFNSRGTVMVPVRGVVNALNGSFKYDETRQRIIATVGNDRVVIGLGSRIALVNDSRRVPLEGVARKLNGEYYVPAKFFSGFHSYKVGWDASSRTVTISSVASEQR